MQKAIVKIKFTSLGEIGWVGEVGVGGGGEAIHHFMSEENWE